MDTYEVIFSDGEHLHFLQSEWSMKKIRKYAKQCKVTIIFIKNSQIIQLTKLSQSDIIKE